MADGATFEIDITAKSFGVDTSAAQINAFADGIVGVDKVATSFDSVVAATVKRLDEASVAAQAAARDLGRAEAAYGRLEMKADTAAKKLEAAALAGKDTKKLQAAADEAAAAMRAQGVVVDQLAAKSREAAGAQGKLAASLKVLEGRQKGAADGLKAGSKAAKASSVDLAKYGKAGALAFLAVGAGALAAVGTMARFAVASNPVAMMRLNIASQRLQFSLVKLFRGLDLSKFLGGMDRLGALFDTTNTSGRALKLLIETVMQPLFDAVGKLEPYIGEFFKGLIYGALRVVLGVLRLRNAIFEAMSPETRAEIKKLVDKVFTLENAFMLGEVAAVAFAVVVGGVVLIALAACAIAAASLAAALSVVAVALAGIGLTIGLLVGIVLLPFVLLGVAVAGIVALFDGTWDDFAKTMKGLAKKAWNWGSDIVNGLTGGLLGGSEDLSAAGAKIAAQVQASIKTPLKIKSPSLVMREIGANTAAGLVQGLERGEGSARDASAGLGDAVTEGVGQPRAGAGGSNSSGGRRLHIEHLHIGDSPVARSNFEAFKRMADEWLEGAALTFGGGEVPT